VKSGQEIRATRLYQVRSGDFVYNRLFAWKGAFALATKEADGCSVSNEFPCFEIDSTQLDGRFLWSYFRRENAWNEALGLSTGATPTSRNRLKESLFLKMRMPLPPLAEQRQIVEQVDALAGECWRARKLRGEAAEMGETLGRSLLKGSISDAANQYGTEPLAAVAKTANGFGFPTSYQGRTGLPYPFLKVSDMNLPGNEREMKTSQNWVGPEDVEKLRLRIYPAGTTIFPKIGGAIATNKRRVLAMPSTFDNNVMGLIPSPRLNWEYLFCFMLSIDLVMLQAGTSVPAVSQRKIESLRVPVPSPADQQRIVADIHEAMVVVDGLRRLQVETAAELDALLPAILDRAFKGEL
jgi:type I restriction enzyme S subunit